MKAVRLNLIFLSLFCTTIRFMATASTCNSSSVKTRDTSVSMLRVVLGDHPVFAERKSDPLLEMRYRRADFMDSIYCSFDKKSAGSINSVFLYSRYNSCDSLVLLDSSRIRENDLIVRFKLPTLYTENDSVSLVIGVSLHVHVVAGDSIGARFSRVKFADADTGISLNENCSPLHRLPVGKIVRNKGQDGVHTYRIPGMAMTASGRLVSVYDVRYSSLWDLPGNIDIGMSYSDDQGSTWSKMQIIMHREKLQDTTNGIGDPCVLFDNKTNTLWVAALWSKGDHAFHHSGPGWSPDQSGQWVLSSSKDNGRTWSALYNITTQVKNPEWRLAFQGPGNGICLKNGTLVFPAQFKDATGMVYSTIAYSKDSGYTWQIGKGVLPNTTEAAVIETTDGSLLLNMRDNRGGYRSLYRSSDLGQHWQDQEEGKKQLIDPICMGSMISFMYHGKKILAFSNPHVQKGRRNLTIQFSFDEGKTWLPQYNILVDERPFFGYSSLVYTGDGAIGILYEGKGDLLYTKFRLPF